MTVWVRVPDASLQSPKAADKPRCVCVDRGRDRDRGKEEDMHERNEPLMQIVDPNGVSYCVW